MKKFIFLSLIATLSLSAQAVQAQIYPDDVEGLSAEAGNQNVVLSWTQADDADGIVLGYKVYLGTESVQEPGDAYDTEILTNDSLPTFTVENLQNDVTYFFAVTALDDEGNESLNYSLEVAGIPRPSGDSTGRPRVIGAEQISPTKVSILMSEPVAVGHPTQGFSIQNMETDQYVPLLNTQLNSENVRLVVEAGLLEVGVSYEVTATSLVRDLEGNPVSSGITDSAMFQSVGGLEEIPDIVTAVEVPDFEAEVESTFEPEPEPEPEQAPLVLNEEITLTSEPEEAPVFFPEETLGEPIFEAVEEEIPFEDGSEIGSEEDSEALDPLSEAQFSSLLESLIGSEEAPEQPESNDVVVENTPLSSAPKLNIGVKEVSDLKIEIRSGENKASLTWSAPEGLADQVVYLRENQGAWDQGLSVGGQTESVSIDIKNDTSYQVRIVTLNSEGVESFGLSDTFETTLAKSGPGSSVVALMLLVILFLAFVVFGARRT